MAERDKLKWWCLGRRKKGGEAFGLTYSILNSSVFSRETTSILNSSASCCTLAQNYSTLTLIFLSLYMDLINQSWLQKIPGFFRGNNHIFHTFLWFFFRCRWWWCRPSVPCVRNTLGSTAWWWLSSPTCSGMMYVHTCSGQGFGHIWRDLGGGKGLFCQWSHREMITTLQGVKPVWNIWEWLPRTELILIRLKE